MITTTGIKLATRQQQLWAAFTNQARLVALQGSNQKMEWSDLMNQWMGLNSSLPQIRKRRLHSRQLQKSSYCKGFQGALKRREGSTPKGICWRSLHNFTALQGFSQSYLRTFTHLPQNMEDGVLVSRAPRQNLGGGWKRWRENGARTYLEIWMNQAPSPWGCHSHTTLCLGVFSFDVMHCVRLGRCFWSSRQPKRFGWRAPGGQPSQL